MSEVRKVRKNEEGEGRLVKKGRDGESERE